VSLLLVLSPFVGGRVRPDQHYLGAFSASGLVRLVREGELLARLPQVRAEVVARIAETRGVLLATPNDLARLDGADVFLFLIESYGETVLRSPAKAARVNPAFDTFERELGVRGFEIASSVLESPTNGGGSWLAHATLASGIRIDDQLAYDVVILEKPLTVPDFFRRAGYRSVLVQPGMTRTYARGEYLNFDRRYDAARFDYRGPSIGWGRFPDQYVIDFVHRREADRRSGPLFFQYVLVTSHVPWSAEPPIIEDWARIGDGTVYREQPGVNYPAGWTNLTERAGAYCATIVYDLEVIRRYVAEFVREPALVIVMGDHQPVGHITESLEQRGVPIHVMSRRRELVEPFVRRGYTPGMRPKAFPPYVGMDRFLHDFLRDFSREVAEPLPASNTP
jgi:hypothetical protein